MPESEDFEPYKALKNAARKVGNFVGVRSMNKASSGPGPRRTDAEIREAKAMPKQEIDRQNASARKFASRNQSSRSSSR